MYYIVSCSHGAQSPAAAVEVHIRIILGAAIGIPPRFPRVSRGCGMNSATVPRGCGDVAAHGNTAVMVLAVVCVCI